MVATKREMSDGEIYESFSRRANPEAHAAIEATMHELFDGSEPGLIEAERKLFEADAEQYGFDLTRHQCAAPEPWSEYASEVTGHRWGGWLAARAMPSKRRGELTPEAQPVGGQLDRHVMQHCCRSEEVDEHIEAALMEAGARINALAANERRLIDELAKARKDARRYRWLRGGHGSAAAAQHEESADKGWERVNWLYDEDVDALIDAEMAAEPAVGAA